MRLVNAQQARRVVDRLVGYRLSPFLWSKVQKGIGAGRVSSVALRLVVDREEEIRKFVAVESWTIDVELSRNGDERRFLARLNRPLGAAAGESDTKFRGAGDRPQARGRELSGHRRRAEAPDQELEPSVHHVDAAAGRVEQAAHAAARRHARRSAAVRGRRAR
jgi:DNA topoisomerase-1